MSTSGKQKLPTKCQRWPNKLLLSRSWPLTSEGSLACHTYCDTGHPFIMVITEDPWHSHLLPSFWQWSCHYLFLRLRSVATGNRTPISRIRGERPTSTPPRIQLTSILLLSLRNWEIIYAAELVHFVMECLVLSPLVATDLIREDLNIKWQIHC